MNANKLKLPLSCRTEVITRGMAKGKTKVAAIIDADGRPVISPNYCLYDGDVWQYWLSVSDEHLEFITQAANLHGELVRALKIIQENSFFGDSTGYFHVSVDAMKEAITTLQKATSKEGK